MTGNTIDVVMRFHDIARLAELEAAVFSLVAQTYRPVNVIIVLQRFMPEDSAKVHRAVERLCGADVSMSFQVIDWNEPEPADARSELINHGISNTKGRYLAFLDYDDVLYPEAYEMLIERLTASGTAIAFADIEISRVNIYHCFAQVVAKEKLYPGKSVIDLFDANFCPIHSFIIDRSAVRPQDLYFDATLTRGEDYDFLIRLCARYRSDFQMIDRVVGAYIFKDDGSNTLLVDAEQSADRVSAWRRAENFLEARRLITPVSTEVQKSLGINIPQRDLTVRGLLLTHGRESKHVGNLVDVEAHAAFRSAARIVAPQEPRLWIEPGHFYSPIPDPRKLRNSSFEQRREQDMLRAVNVDLDRMADLFTTLASQVPEIQFPNKPDPAWRYSSDNDQYGFGDAIILCGMIRMARPTQIIEVGSGFSSAVILDTLDRTPAMETQCTFIDPYPGRLKALLRPDDTRFVTICQADVQEVPLDMFSKLQANDILFLDTTHVSKTGSDLNHEVFQILPRLNKGVIVHFHDVFANFEYPDAWIFEQNRAWNELYLLRAFLMYNNSFEIMYMSHAFARARPEVVGAKWPQLADEPGGALWLRKLVEADESAAN